MVKLIGNEQWSPVQQRGQVYLATHDGEGNPLSAMQKSFISFSWSDDLENQVFIEDFNFIVTIDGDRWERGAYAPFSDSTTELETLDGQYFWRSVYSANEIELTLSTDGVEEATLQSFRNYFRPGIIRKLVLAENSNRYAFARISEAPQISMIPFEEPVEVTIGNNTYITSTTKWRGDITLTFVLDDPFWYSIEDIFNDKVRKLSKDQVKTVIEDGIPSRSMINDENNIILFANDIICDKNEFKQYNFNLSVAPNTDDVYLYYCGTAPARPILSFEFTPEISDNYIVNPVNKFTNLNNSLPYNYIQVGSHKFSFTTPSILTAYNQVIKILTEDFKAGDSIIDVKKAIQNSVNNIYARMTALSICELSMDSEWNNTMGISDSTSGALNEEYASAFIEYFRQMLYFGDNEPVFNCTFNSKTGEAKIQYNIQTLDAKNKAAANGDFSKLIREGYADIKENVGDMIRSDYLIIDERTLPKNYMVDANKCLKVSANCTLNNVHIEYKNMYL